MVPDWALRLKASQPKRHDRRITTNADGLAPCPHCGGSDVELAELSPGWFTVFCPTCAQPLADRAAVIERYNTRAKL